MYLFKLGLSSHTYERTATRVPCLLYCPVLNGIAISSDLAFLATAVEYSVVYISHGLGYQMVTATYTGWAFSGVVVVNTYSDYLLNS